MTEKGEEYLNKAFDIKGNSAEDYAWRGRIYYDLGQYDNAQTELKSALDKESVIANLYIAQVYEAQGDSENAETYYQNYVNSGSADSQAMNALGEIEMAKGNYSGALTYLEQGIAMENVTNRRELMQNLIICYEYTSDFNSAWNVVQEYVQVYPDDASPGTALPASAPVNAADAAEATAVAANVSPVDITISTDASLINSITDAPD